MIFQWRSQNRSPGTGYLPPDTGFHGGERSLSALWMVFHPEACPVPVPVPAGQYCRNTSRRCMRNDRSPCSRTGSELPGRAAGR